MTATWADTGNHSYNDPLNWDIGVVPINNGTDEYVVDVLTGTVTYDVITDPGEVLQFKLDSGTTLNIQGRNFVVTDSATIGGQINVISGSFVATHPSSLVTGDRMTISVDTSATSLPAEVTLGVTGTYIATSNSIQDATILSANGGGATLNLPNLSSIDSYVNHLYARNRTVSATNGGAIDLSGVTTLRGGSGDDRLLFSTISGGTIDISNLQQVTAGTVAFKTDTTTLDLNKLAEASALNFELATPGTTVNMPMLHTQTGGSYYVQNGHIFNVGSLNALTNAYVEISDPTAQFNSGGLANIDNTQFILSNGAQLNKITATSYLTTSSTIQASTIMSADGAGTFLDASSLTSIDNYVNHLYARDRTISATAGGAIDLSGITTLRGGSGDDRLVFSTTGGGTIDLSNLQQIAGGTVGFKTDTTTLDLNALTETTGLSFELVTTGTTVNMPLLNTQTSGSYYVENGHIFNAGSLNTLTNGYVEVTDPTAQFNTGGLANIDNTQFILTSGAQLSEITATSYLTTSSTLQASTIMSADGAGTLLDASSLTSIDNYVNHLYARDRTISATAGGTIDLSGITTLRGGSGDDRLVLTATTGGTIDLSSFQQVTAGNVVFNATDGGNLAFGDLNVTNTVDFNIADANTEVSFGHLALAADANLAVTGGAKVKMGGDFSSELTDEALFDMDTGLMQFDGGGVRWLEVAGMDNGVSGVGTNNFGLAQLIVGSDTQTTDVVLTDLFDNGNHGSATEALYLLGSGGLDGLQILGGSTLYIGDIPVYTMIGGQMTELHDLFGPGETVITYTNFGSDGYIVAVPEPSTFALLLLGLATLAFFRRKR
ncbi:MAG: PEP-CTERM sorting domain-containing protein [Planctomycetia bacterium]